MTPTLQAEQIVFKWELASGVHASIVPNRADLVSAISKALTEAKRDLAKKMIAAVEPDDVCAMILESVVESEGIELE